MLLQLILSLLALSSVAAAPRASGPPPAPGPTAFQLAAPESLETGRELYDQLVSDASRETFLQRLFRADCYSRALATLNKDCRSLSDAERTKLAMLMLNCFLANTLGRQVRCTAAMSTQECTRQLDTDTFHAYTVFYANVHTLCVFIQNRDFQRQAEVLVTQMYGAAATAGVQLELMRGNLSEQGEVLHGLKGGLADVAVQQERLSDSVQRGVEQLQGLTQQASVLQNQVNASLEASQQVQALQLSLSTGLRQLEEEARRGADEARHMWRELEGQAVALEERQLRYEELQNHLVTSAHQLAGRSVQLQATVDSVLAYERRSEAALGFLMGRSCSLSDVTFYAGSAALSLLMGALPSRAAQACVPRLLLLLTATLAAERLAVTTPLGSGGFAQVARWCAQWLAATAGPLGGGGRGAWAGSAVGGGGGGGSTGGSGGTGGSPGRPVAMGHSGAGLAPGVGVEGLGAAPGPHEGGVDALMAVIGQEALRGAIRRAALVLGAAMVVLSVVREWRRKARQKSVLDKLDQAVQDIRQQQERLLHHLSLPPLQPHQALPPAPCPGGGAPLHGHGQAAPTLRGTGPGGSRARGGPLWGAQSLRGPHRGLSNLGHPAAPAQGAGDGFEGPGDAGGLGEPLWGVSNLGRPTDPRPALGARAVGGPEGLGEIGMGSGPMQEPGPGAPVLQAQGFQAHSAGKGPWEDGVGRGSVQGPGPVTTTLQLQGCQAHSGQRQRVAQMDGYTQQAAVQQLQEQQTQRRLDAVSQSVGTRSYPCRGEGAPHFPPGHYCLEAELGLGYVSMAMAYPGYRQGLGQGLVGGDLGAGDACASASFSRSPCPSPSPSLAGGPMGGAPCFGDLLGSGMVGADAWGAVKAPIEAAPGVSPLVPEPTASRVSCPHPGLAQGHAPTLGFPPEGKGLEAGWAVAQSCPSPPRGAEVQVGLGGREGDGGGDAGEEQRGRKRGRGAEGLLLSGSSSDGGSGSGRDEGQGEGERERGGGRRGTVGDAGEQGGLSSQGLRARKRAALLEGGWPRTGLQ